MKNYIIYSVTLFLLISCTNKKNKAILHFEKAKEFLKKKEIKNASSEIENAILLDSSNLDFQMLKSRVLVEMDNYEQAILILSKIQTNNFKQDTISFDFGTCYFNYASYYAEKKNDEYKSKEMLEKSISYFSKAIDLDPKYFKAYIGKQRAFHNLSRFDEALIVLNTALQLFPDSMVLICNQGVEKLYLGDLFGAMSDLNKAIESNKLDSTDLALAYRFRGNVYIQKGDNAKAISDLTSALNLNAVDEYSLLTRAECYKVAGMKDKACEDYRKAADLGFVSIYKTIKDYCVD